MSGTDWTGISATVTAFFAGVIGILGLLKTNSVHKEVKNTNGSSTGLAVEEIHAAVTTPPNTPPLGVVAADTNALVHGNGDH